VLLEAIIHIVYEVFESFGVILFDYTAVSITPSNPGKSMRMAFQSDFHKQIEGFAGINRNV
jgi:hypothetical protein